MNGESRVSILGKIWLQRLLNSSSEARSSLLMGALKRGAAEDEAGCAQLQLASGSRVEGGGAKEPEPRE